MKKGFLLPLLITGIIGWHGCQTKEKTTEINIDKIVSLDGTLTEILCELGFEKNIIGVDVTSNYPASVNSLPKAGHNRNVNAESVIALQPTLVITLETGLKPEVAEQFKSAGINVLTLKKESTLQGAKDLIQALSDSLNKKEDALRIIAQIDDDLAKLPQYDTISKPKVLFIYARGAGTMSVAGRETALHTMIEMAGGINAAADIEGFKPFTAEAVVKENPDVILFFDSGLESLGGAEGLLEVPGIASTNAGKNKKFVTLDGQYLAGLGPRTGKAVVELAALIHDVTQ